MIRRALLLAVLALAALPVAAPAAAPAPTGAFDFGRTLDRSAGWGTAVYNGPTEPVFNEVAMPGAPRPWHALRVPPGANLSVSPLADDFWMEDAPHPSWTVAILVRLDEVTGPFDLLRVGDLAIRVDEGRLAAAGAPLGPGTLTAGAWHQIVVTRDDVSNVVTAYVDGVEDLTLTDTTGAGEYDDSLLVFAHGESDGGGDLARLRGWAQPLAGSDVAGLDRLDVTPPSIGVLQPEEGGNAGLRPRFHGSLLADDGTSKWNMRTEITLRDPEGEVAAVYPLARPRMYGPQGDWVREWPGGDPLTRGVRYTAEIVVTDGAGNTTTLERELVADDPPPQMIIHEPGAETSDTTPHLRGWTSRWEGDIPWTHASLLVPDGPGMRGVSSVRMDLAADGTFEGDFPEVPPGDYTLRVTHVDQGVRTVVVEQPLRVLAQPAEPLPEPKPQEPSRQEPAPSGVADAGALRRSVLAALRRLRTTTFARGGAQVRFSATSPGAATVSVLMGRRTVARGSRTLARAGRTTVTVRPTTLGRRALRRAGRARLTLRSTFRPRGGRPATATAAVTLRR